MRIKRILFAFFIIFLLLFALGLVFYIFGDSDKSSLVGDNIGVVEVNGVIKDSREELKQLNDFGKDSKIKAIIIRIDSPGGAVGPSQELYSEIMKIKARKPVIASIGTMGASGGYYIASGASKIVANPGSITGSIGVIMQFMNFQNLMGKIGIKGNVVKSGQYKDTGSPFRDMTKEERELMQSVIDDVHTQFVDAVIKGRKLKKEEVLKIADGRIITGKQAKELNLIDELGNFNDAVELAKKMANITGEAKLVYAKKKKGILYDLLGEFADNDVKSNSKFFLFLSHLRIPQYLSPLVRYFEDVQ